jgi:hypothetical protein
MLPTCARYRAGAALHVDPQGRAAKTSTEALVSLATQNTHAHSAPCPTLKNRKRMSSSCASGISRITRLALLTSLPRMLPGWAARLRSGQGGAWAEAAQFARDSPSAAEPSHKRRGKQRHKQDHFLPWLLSKQPPHTHTQTKP